jgi:flotillin
VKRQLDADVVQPAEAERRAREEQARGQAATVIERGRAEAEALKKLVEAFRKAGPSGREVLALQKLLPLIGDIAGARQKLTIGKVTVLPGGGDGASQLARSAIGAAAQLQAATGVDVVDALTKRLGAAGTSEK